MDSSALRIGTICQPHITGIGIQGYEFCRHMAPKNVLLTDLTELHSANSRNQKRVTTVDWYDKFNHRRCEGIPSREDLDWLLTDIDILYVIETPLFWEVFDIARGRGVKSALALNYEFLEHSHRPVPKPDLFLGPSPWNLSQVRRFGKVKHLPVPIATDRIERREITKAKRFVHVVGYKAHLDRNGTEIVENSLRHINPTVSVEIKDQSKGELENYWDLYKEGDVLLMPRRYGGLCLTLQEAAASGMPIVVTEKDPYAGEQCTVTIPPPYEQQTLQLKSEVESYSASPESLAEVVNELSGRMSIEELSEKTYEWAQRRSWAALKPEYERVLGSLL